ncbi:hypothetical protein QO003_000849 [Arthrobacter silviterrae]|nr:hypothetical protein [Arthrobacter silviterrae]MDQ0276546.1 hypothetical protein [Arthrobacter silviterrae]
MAQSLEDELNTGQSVADRHIGDFIVREAIVVDDVGEQVVD